MIEIDEFVSAHPLKYSAGHVVLQAGPMCSQ
jgi:hypothetical protein